MKSSTLQSQFNALVIRLVLGVALVLLVSVGLFVFVVEKYRDSLDLTNQVNADIFELQRAITETSNIVDRLTERFEVNYQTQLEDKWHAIYKKIDNLKIYNGGQQTDELITSLYSLEIKQWRLVDIKRIGLHEVDKKYLQEVIKPQFQSLFELSTQLVNLSKELGRTDVLGASANVRGFSTFAQTILEKNTLDGFDVNWGDYYRSHEIVEIEIASLMRLANTNDALKRVTEAYRQQYGRLTQNNEKLKELNRNSPYYNIERLHVEILKDKQKISQLLFKLHSSFKQAVLEQKESIFNYSLMVFFALAVLVALGCFLLHRWREYFISSITEPVALITDKSRQIATGNLDIELDSTSNILEVKELIVSVNRIKQIIAENRQKGESYLKLAAFKEGLSHLLISEKDSERFFKAAMQRVIGYVDASAAALHMLDDKEVGKISLVQSQNMPSSMQDLVVSPDAGILDLIESAGTYTTINLNNKEVKFSSLTVDIMPSSLCLVPIRLNEKLIGVFELLIPNDESYESDTFEEALEQFVSVLIEKLSQEKLAALLKKTQQQQIQLSEAMDELKLQNQNIQRSETELEAQADELRIINEQLKNQNIESEAQQAQLKELNDKLEEKAKELTKANEMKSQFLSKVSHELRTPLNSIMILIQTLLRDTDKSNTSQIKSLEVIDRSAKDLLELINDLLDMAKIEAGKVTLHIDESKLELIIQRLKETFEPIASNRNLDFYIELADNLPKVIHTDPQRLLQILRNLLSNAFKFTKKGQVKLKVLSVDGWFRFIVSDTGVGIPESQLALIFNAFHQIQNGMTSSREGTGLGLSISAQLTEMLNGRISLTSQLGKGTEFVLDMPQIYIDSNNVEVAHINKKPIWYIDNLDTKIAKTLNKEISSTVDLCDLSDFSEASLRSSDVGGLILICAKDNQLMARWNDSETHKKIEWFATNDKLFLIESSKLPSEYLWLEPMVENHYSWIATAKKSIVDIMTHKLKADTANPSVVEKSFDLIEKDSSADNTEQEQQEFKWNDKFNNELALIVDDDMRSLFSLSQLLKAAGLKTELADNLELACDKLEKHSVDLIICDLVLHDGNGLDFLKRVKGTKQYEQLPFIVASAKNLDEERIQCLSNGATAYLDKPLDSEELFTTITHALK